MKSFLCYIHSSGVETPQLRTLAAPCAARLPDIVSENMASWPTLANIEFVEVCSEDNEVVLTMRADDLKGRGRQAGLRRRSH